MQRIMCKSKLHLAVVTDANLNYEGSITIDEALLEAADMLAFERVQVVNVNNGSRFETYIIVGERGSRAICLNGPAARLGEVGDRVIVLSYAMMSDEEAKTVRPKIIVLGEDNRILERKE